MKSPTAVEILQRRTAMDNLPTPPDNLFSCQETPIGNILVIEKNMPMPMPKYGPAYSVLDKLELGDSVLFPKSVKLVSLKAGIRYRHLTTEKKFSRRKVEDGIRVWRTK